MIISIIAVLFTFGLVIFLHEFGHFTVCKLVGIRVDEFSFGFGSELVGFTRGDTRYSLRLIPLGGYVKPAGENLEEMEAPQAAAAEPGGKPAPVPADGSMVKSVKVEPYMYFAKPWYTRLAVVFAGPVMNYLLAFALFTGVILVAGEPAVSEKAQLGDVSQGYPADIAGLKSGDLIIKIDGRPLAAWKDMAGLIYAKADKEISVTYSRGGAESTVKMTTKKAPDGSGRGVIGIAPAVVYKDVPFVKGVAMGAHQCWYWTAFTVRTLASNIYRREKPDLAGPIGIVNIVSKAAHTGLSDLVFLIGLISVAVGFFNLLPIPLLDGGHAVLYLFEGVSRRKLTPDVMKYVNGAGIAVLLSILLFATYNDIMRIVSARSARKAAAAAAQQEPGK